MRTIFNDIVTAILTEQTCGEACWHAKEDICRCSCGGKNHGCLRSANSEQPERTCRIKSGVYKLIAVGSAGDLEDKAQEINKRAGIDFLYAHTSQDRLYSNIPAKMKCASQSQINTWPELSAWRGKTETELYFDRKPYLLWHKVE